MLRCAADVGSLFEAGIRPMLDDDAAEWLAWEAKRAVQQERPRVISHVKYDEGYRWLLLEAAARLEEGSWPR